MFIGESHNKIDEKGRVRVPSKFKDELGANYYVTKGNRHCLYVVTKEAFDLLYQKMLNVNTEESGSSDISTRDLLRFFFSSAMKAEEDGQGRILISPSLRAYAGLNDEKDLVIIGSGDRVEIWSESNWQKFNTAGDFDFYLKSI